MAITRYRRALIPLAFDKQLTTAGTPETLVGIPAGKRGVSIFLSVRTANCRLGFDVTAGPTGLRVESGGQYEDDVTIKTLVSFVGDPGGKPRVYGIIWLE